MADPQKFKALPNSCSFKLYPQRGVLTCFMAKYDNTFITI